jgi:pimeloyl-ACP methyl ester carboxylesterase
MVEVSVTTSLPWHQRVGNQRDWVWRGWQTRYTYLRAVNRDRKPPLMLLHGFGASIGHWRHNLEVLSQSHTVYALDMLGFGASEKASANYSAALWVEQIYDFWQTFIRQPVVLIGNSIGSLICLAVAQAHPEMVAGIAMLSLPDPSVREDMMPKFLLPAIATIEGWFTSPLLLKAVFKIVRRPQVVRPWARIAYANPEAVTDELVDILVGPAQDRGSAQAFSAILKAMTSAKFGPKVKEVLPTLKMPLLLIWGRQDRMIPYSQAEQFIRYNPQLQLIEIDQAGHCPHDECPDAVNQALLDWLNTWGEPAPNLTAFSMVDSISST